MKRHRDTDQLLGDLSDSVAERIQCPVSDCEREIGVGCEGLLVNTSECDAGHDGID